MIDLLQVAIRQQFWPTDANSWLQLATVVAGATAALLGFVWKVLMKPMRDRLDDMKERIAGIATESHSALGKIDMLERTQASSTSDCSDLHEDVGRLEGEVRGMAAATQTAELKRLEELGAIRERLASIETLIRERTGNAPDKGR